MKRPYESPTFKVVILRIERGFAVSNSYGIQQFQYDVDENNPGNVENTAW